MSFATLGDGDTQVIFEVNADKIRTWTDMRRSGEGRWAEHDVFAGKPVAEFIGPGLDTLTLSVRLDAARGVMPLDEVKNLRLLRDNGAVLPLIVGDELVGDFVLKGLSEDERRFDPKGALLLAVVELTLREYH